MGNMELQSKFSQILEDSLRSLSRGDYGASYPPPRLAHWGLSGEDEAALREFGIPVMEPHGGRHGVQLVGDIQDAPGPEIKSTSGNAFRLADYWGRSIGVLQGSSLVIAVPHDDDQALGYVNSTVQAFVETSWRWCFASRLLKQMTDSEQLYGNLERFFDLACELDSEVGEESRFNWWPGIIGGW